MKEVMTNALLCLGLLMTIANLVYVLVSRRAVEAFMKKSPRPSEAEDDFQFKSTWVAMVVIFFLAGCLLGVALREVFLLGPL